MTILNQKDIEKEIKHYKLIKRNELTAVYLLPNGNFLKVFNPVLLHIFKIEGKDIEQNLLDLEKLNIDSRVVIPSAMIYTNDNMFWGYITEPVKGITLGDHIDGLTPNDRIDLNSYAKIYQQLEEIIKNSPDLVFTDLLNYDNIIFNIVDKNISLSIIDCDGVQVENKEPICLTDLLRHEITEKQESPLNWSKYTNPNGSFTKQLDIKSLIYLYFHNIFRINLSQVGKRISENEKRIITLDDVFHQTNISKNEAELWDLMHKIWKLNQPNQENEFISDEVLELTHYFNTVNMIPKSNPNGFYRCLVRK